MTDEDKSNPSSCIAIKDDIGSTVHRLSPTENRANDCIFPKLPPKTLKVDIDIPMWSNSEDVLTDTDIDLPAEKGDAKELICDEDDVDEIQSLISSKSSDSSRLEISVAASSGHTLLTHIQNLHGHS